MASPSPPSALSSLFPIFCFLCHLALPVSSSPTGEAIRFPLRFVAPPPPPPRTLASLASASLLRARRLKRPDHPASAANPPPPPFPSSRTPLSPHSYGGYSVSLGFGTPPQRLPFVLDTGSDLVWAPCTRSYRCSNCSPPSGAPTPVFSPRSSSSAKLIGCRNPKCTWVHSPDSLSQCRRCPLNNASAAAAHCSPVCPPYTVVYGKGSTGGLLLSESLEVMPSGSDGGAGPGPVTDFVLGCSLFSSRQPPAGVVGFGRGPASLPAQLGLRRFSYCLLSRLYDDRQGEVGAAVLGGSPASSEDGFSSTPFLRNPAVGSPFSIYYYVGLRRITVAGAKVKIPHSALRPLPGGDGGTIVDSGTTFSYMEPGVFEPVAEAVEAAVGGRYNRSAAAETMTGLRPCFAAAGGRGVEKRAAIRLPELAFHFKGGAAMELPLANYFAYAGETGALCLTVVTDGGGGATGDGGGPSIIVGSFQQQNYDMVYDLERERLGFRRQSCLEAMG